MKKNWQIILVHLGIQAFIGGLLLAANSKNYKGQYGALGFVLTYFPIAIGAILVSAVILKYLNKRNNKVVLINSLLSLCMWFIIPGTVLRSRTVMRENEGEAQSQKLNEEYKNSSINAAEQMGLSSYSWNPTLKQIEMTTAKFNRHNIVFTGRSLIVYTWVQTPVYNDTLAWLKLTLSEASVYLNSNSYKVLDSCIRFGIYKFQSNRSQRTGEQSIGVMIYPDSNSTAVGISGATCNDPHFAFANFRFSLEYGKQTKR